MNRFTRSLFSLPTQGNVGNASNCTLLQCKIINSIDNQFNKQIRNYAVPRHHTKARRYKMSKWVPQTRYQPISLKQRALLAEYKEAMWESKGKRYKWRQELSGRSQFLKDRGILKFEAQSHLPLEERTRAVGGFIQRVNKKKQLSRINKGELPPQYLIQQLKEAEEMARPYKDQIEKLQSEETEEKTRKRQEKIKEMEEEAKKKQKDKYR